MWYAAAGGKAALVGERYVWCGYGGCVEEYGQAVEEGGVEAEVSPPLLSPFPLMRPSIPLSSSAKEGGVYLYPRGQSPYR